MHFGICLKFAILGGLDVKDRQTPAGILKINLTRF
uniref:Uncharacterized protein n=1 Tax=Siphoviridae sp. ctwIM10 TaxID=2825728 RepID=A0A8S5U883_9CAUD|nr:MAG TPA: hypothetical protein [Siphoviridae sp. ctwIM10]